MMRDRESNNTDEGRRRAFRAFDLVHGTDLIVAAILLALCAWLYYLTTTFEAVAQLFAQDVPPEFLPRLLIWTIAILSLLIPFEHLLKPHGRAHFDKDRSKPITPMAYITAGLLALIVLSIELVGTYIAIVLACLLVPVLWGEHRWKLLIPYALIFSTTVVLLFSKLLGVYFEPGLLGIDMRWENALEPVIEGLSLIADPFNISLIFMGVLIGVIVGALPGLSSPMAVALLLPFTISLEPVPAIAMMAALYCAGTFGGSITAILINAPGAPPAAATALDGYPMASRGEAGRALGIAAVSSICGGIFSLVIFLLATPWLARIATSFRPMEYFALAIFALSMLASISGKSSLRNLIGGAIGVLIGTVGIHLTTGVERFTFGVPELTEGIQFIPVLIGLFAMGELLNQSQTLKVSYKRISAVVVRLPSREDFRRIRGTILRSAGLGTFIGILPAEGATVAALMGYNEAKRWAKNKEEFGTGCPEGIAGPEAANNAATGGAMVPTLALGIPGSATTAIILAALIMHGFRPGPFLMKETPEFVYAIFAAMLVANFMFLAIGLAGAKLFSRVTLIPRTLLWPAVFVFCLIGSYSAGASLFDVWVMLISGVVGFIMRRHGFSPAPLVMGLILGKLVEESLSQSMILLDNNWLRFFESPIVDLFFALTVLGLTWPWLSALASSLWSLRKTAEAGDD